VPYAHIVFERPKRNKWSLQTAPPNVTKTPQTTNCNLWKKYSSKSLILKLCYMLRVFSKERKSRNPQNPCSQLTTKCILLNQSGPTTYYFL
jgi:hypothetical protein